MTPTGRLRKKQVKHAKAPQVLVTIRQKEIDESTKKDSGHCMIAEALKLSVEGATGVSVDLQTIRFSDPILRRRYTYLTPRIAQLALVDFDQGRKPPPFSFKLRGGAVTAMAGTVGKSNRNGALHPTGKKTLVRSRRSTGTVSEIVGGKTPPVGALASSPHAGRRREFGLRALGR